MSKKKNGFIRHWGLDQGVTNLLGVGKKGSIGMGIQINKSNMREKSKTGKEREKRVVQGWKKTCP